MCTILSLARSKSLGFKTDYIILNDPNDQIINACLEVIELVGVGVANGMDLEANLSEGLVVEDVPSIEDEGRLGHRRIDFLVVVRLELVPLGQDGHGVRTGAGVVGVGAGGDLLLKAGGVGLVYAAGVVHLDPHVVPLHLGVEDVDLGPLLEEVADDEHRRGLPHVAGVLLEGVAEDGHLLARGGVEHLAHHLLREALLLVVVHEDDLVPVGGALVEAVGFAEVDEVEDVLLEARAAEPDGGLEEAPADPVVLADGAADLGHVGPGGLAQGRDGVDGRNALGEEGVGHELGQLGRPKVGGEDVVPLDPVGVDAGELLGCGDARGILLPADEDAVGLHEVVDGGALGEELRVGQHLELEALLVDLEDAADGLGGTDGDGRLLDNDLVGGRDLGNLTSAQLAVLDVGGPSGADSLRLGRGVDGNEDDVGPVDLGVNVGGEEQVATAALLDDLG
mmetsp:Transcript_5034/g.14298  ORF Transcript_5034/g.14298 Transcript_5034/m.14298 type:complete len:451 (+) Transcript_5034:158-1510(+)